MRRCLGLAAVLLALLLALIPCAASEEADAPGAEAALIEATGEAGAAEAVEAVPEEIEAIEAVPEEAVDAVPEAETDADAEACDAACAPDGDEPDAPVAEAVEADIPETEWLLGEAAATEAACAAVEAAGELSTEGESVPDESVPDATTPNETVPNETIPNETIQETTVPETTAPDAAAPEATVPNETTPEATAPDDNTPAEAPAPTESAARSEGPTPPEPAREMGPQALPLGVGESVRLPEMPGGAATVYASMDKKIATVSADGVVRGRKRGQTSVVAFDGANTVEYAVTVYAAPKRVRLAAKRLTLSFDAATNQGEQARLAPTLSPGSSSGLSYYGYDPGVVSVSLDGTVTAVAPGTTTVRVRTYNDKRAKVRIRVVSAAGAPPAAAGTGRTKVIAHRGSAHWAENSLDAFRNFAATGADAVELDARSTLDGVQVIFHDRDLTVDGVRYAVSGLTLDQLRALRPSVCTLDEALEAIAPTGREIFLELKDTADGAKCVLSVLAHGLELRTVYFSFYEDRLREVHAAFPPGILGLSLSARGSPGGRALMRKARRLHVSFFVANRRLVRRGAVERWHAAGYGVYVWTVNDAETARALCDMGVDGILTDYPECCPGAQG